MSGLTTTIHGVPHYCDGKIDSYIFEVVHPIDSTYISPVQLVISNAEGTSVQQIISLPFTGNPSNILDFQNGQFVILPTNLEILNNHFKNTTSAGVLASTAAVSSSQNQLTIQLCSNVFSVIDSSTVYGAFIIPAEGEGQVVVSLMQQTTDLSLSSSISLNNRLVNA